MGKDIRKKLERKIDELKLIIKRQVSEYEELAILAKGMESELKVYRNSWYGKMRIWIEENWRR